MVKRQKAQERGEGLGHCLYWGFHGKGKAGQRKQPGLTALNNFGRLWV